MSGKDAARQILELAAREEYLAADLVARALTLSSRQVIRDWRRRQLREVRVGRTILLPSALVISTYFSLTTPSTNTT